MNSFAVIFDMDGVISDAQKFHGLVESALLKKHGINMTPEKITHRFSGVSLHQQFRGTFEVAGIPLPDLKQMTAEKLTC